MTRKEFLTKSPEQTEVLGQHVGALLDQGAFLALCGELGGGKTCFTRGVVQTIAPESAHLVASPTFAIMNHYPGRVPIYHFDFYRLMREDDIADLGFGEYLHGDGICIVEWSERLESLLPSEYLQITFLYAGDDRRRIIIESRGDGPKLLLSRLQNRLRNNNISLT